MNTAKSKLSALFWDNADRYDPARFGGKREHLMSEGKFIEVAEQYHQSQLQILKEEIDKLPSNGGGDTGLIMRDKVLNLITNLEDNG